MRITKGCNLQVENFEYFSSKASASVESKMMNGDVKVITRVKRDEIIWISISKLGIEGMRAKITADSILVKVSYPRKEYYAMNFDDLNQKIGSNLDFSILQSLILGTHHKSKGEIKIDNQKEFCVIKEEIANQSIESVVDKGIGKINQIKLRDNIKDSELQMKFSEFKEVNGHLFPFHSKLLITTQVQDPINVELFCKSANFDQKVSKFPFNISSSYERK